MAYGLRALCIIRYEAEPSSARRQRLAGGRESRTGLTPCTDEIRYKLKS
jgi:hypothetical protein